MARKGGCVFYAFRKLHYSHITLLFFLYFITIYLYKFHSVLNCIITSYLRMLTKLPKIAKITIFLVLCIPSLLFRCGDIEKNPGSKYLSLTFCHWNLNGLTDHDSIKISLLQAYVTIVGNGVHTPPTPSLFSRSTSPFLRFSPF